MELSIVEKMTVTGFEIPGGIKIKIAHNMNEDEEAGYKKERAAIRRWGLTTGEFTNESLVKYLRIHYPKKLIYTLEELDSISKPSSEEEYLAQRN
jgi:hypothetical protein